MALAAYLHCTKSGDNYCTSDCARVSDTLLGREDMPYMYLNAVCGAFVQQCRSYVQVA